MRFVASLILAAALVVGLGHRASAQTSEFQLWSGLFATADLEPSGPGPALWLDVQARRGESGTVVLLRPGAGYDFAPWLSVWGGYAFTPFFPNDGEAVPEHRAWQQVILQCKTAFDLALQSRTRFEQRFADAGDDVGLRLRQFVRAGLTHESLPLGVVLWNELFIGLNDTDWGAPSGLDQNRLFVGPVLLPAAYTRIELGYLLVYLNREPDDRLIHAVAMNLFLAL